MPAALPCRRRAEVRGRRPFSRADPPALRDAGGVLLLPADEVLVRTPRRATRLLVRRATLEREQECLRLGAAQAGNGVEDGPHVVRMPVAVISIRGPTARRSPMAISAPVARRATSAFGSCRRAMSCGTAAGLRRS